MKTSKMLSPHSELLPNIWRVLHYSQGLKRIQPLETNILKMMTLALQSKLFTRRTRWEAEVLYTDWLSDK